MPDTWGLRALRENKKPRNAGFFIGRSRGGRGCLRTFLRWTQATGREVNAFVMLWHGFCIGNGAVIAWAANSRTGCRAFVQKRAGARLRSRSSSGQADKIAVVFMLENSCDVPTTRPIHSPLTAFRKKMQPQVPECLQSNCYKLNSNNLFAVKRQVPKRRLIVYRNLHPQVAVAAEISSSAEEISSQRSSS